MNRKGAAEYYEHGGAKRPKIIASILRSVTANHRLGRALDIGCGNGSLLEALSVHAESSVGADSSGEALALARERAPTAELVQTDAEQAWPFPNESFDSVFMLDVIEHLRAPARAVEEAYRVLRPHGVLVLTTPNASSPVRYVRGDKWFGVADPDHVSLFSGFTLAHLLRTVGFEVQALRFEPFTGTWLDSLLRPLRIGGTLLAVAAKEERR